MAFKAVDGSIKPDVFFKTVNCSYGVDVIACDAAGNQMSSGHVVRIKNDGTLHLHCSVSKMIGLQLDLDGKIKTSSSYTC